MPRYSWQPIKRGEEIPSGAILGGRTSTDGEVFVGRNFDGEAGKLNLDKGKMWNIWCHKGGDTKEGEILTVEPGCPIQWVRRSKGDALPEDAVRAGNTSSDGAVYPCRRGGHVGKVNLSGDKVGSFWFHGDWFAKKDGEILVIGPPDYAPEWVKQFEQSSGGEARGIGSWIKDHSGGLAVAAVAAAAAGAAAAVAVAAAHGEKTEGEEGGYKPADAPSAPHVKHHEDPKNFDGNLMCDDLKAEERVDWLCKEKGMDHADAAKVVMKEFPDVFKDWWKPHVDCDGLTAHARAKWLIDEKGMSEKDARNQVRNEFPGAFDPAKDKGHYVDGAIPHTLSIEQTKDGPKLKFVVSPRKPNKTTLVAFHYKVNQGASMNFETKEVKDHVYTHVCPQGGGYPLCPPGSEVSYWLAEIVDGLIHEEPHGAGPHHDRRMYWTAR